MCKYLFMKHVSMVTTSLSASLQHVTIILSMYLQRDVAIFLTNVFS